MIGVLVFGGGQVYATPEEEIYNLGRYLKVRAVQVPVLVKTDDRLGGVFYCTRFCNGNLVHQILHRRFLPPYFHRQIIHEHISRRGSDMCSLDDHWHDWKSALLYPYGKLLGQGY